MLVEFSVGNYRSFNEPVVLSMVAINKLKHEKLDKINMFSAPRSLSLLKSAAIYGANASGKSNLIKAMSFMRHLILKSSKESQAHESIPVERFRLSDIAKKEPAYFQIIFYLDGRRYRYGFEVDEHRVQAEWLYHIPSQRETRLFIREDDEYDISSVFREGQGVQKRTRNNALFLSTVSQWNGELARRILGWFQRFNVISGLHDISYVAFTLERFREDEIFRQRIVDFVRESDVGIENIEIEEQLLSESQLPEEVLSFVKQLVPGGGIDREKFSSYRVKTTHRRFDAEQKVSGWEEFDMQRQESEGTQKIFNLSGPILDTLESGKVLVIDEIEARLHPLLTRTIVSLFDSNVTNPHNAQLVFATHDTNILSERLLRRDQIWFTEKDRYGATDLYSLAEYKVRNDDPYKKDYLAGRYGAIPFIGDLVGLVSEGLDGKSA